MPKLIAFHEQRFPTDIALGAVGGPRRRTEIVTLGSGHEQRNARWASSRRHYNAGYGVKSLDDLSRVIAFFEARRGRLYGFRFRDPVDHKSCLPTKRPDKSDQLIGTGDGSTQEFQLIKQYGDAETGWQRKIIKPVENSLLIALDGMTLGEDEDFSVDYTTGRIAFFPDSIPAKDQTIHAGFEFDVPVRFDTDEISLNMSTFRAGDIASIPLVEILQ